ncbi:hypothetical protein [Kocuria palustris]|uniref:hypothetical protein n=1 Tax=Kocuria palustris TaxID=71999 RepID=UPI0021A49F4E|nr:hypothetical protein [Kocuria palustris]MCT1589601.1 hypothetical protein [Kocuria palustris]
MPQILPPADEVWETRRPPRLIVLSLASLLSFLAMIYVQSRDAEIVEASSLPEVQGIEPGPSLTTALGLTILYVVPLLIWLWGQHWMLHVMAVLCFLGLVVFALSAATGLLWSFGVALPAIIGIFVNVGWLLVAYRRGLH